jgi:cullin-associated NEDD8-dissociated protein 1
LHSLAILKQAFKYEDSQRVSITAQNESEVLGGFLMRALEHNQSRIVSETLRVSGLFVTQLQDLEGNLDTQHLSIVKQLYTHILNTKLNKQDIDQEVKQSSIIAIAQIIKVAHEHFTQQELGNII